MSLSMIRLDQVKEIGVDPVMSVAVMLKDPGAGHY